MIDENANVNEQAEDNAEIPGPDEETTGVDDTEEIPGVDDKTPGTDNGHKNRAEPNKI